MMKMQTGAISGKPSMREKMGISEQEFQAMGNIGAMFYEQGQFDKAHTIFEGMLGLEPENDGVLSALGAVLAQQRDDAQALTHLDKAIELNNSEISTYVCRAEIRLRRNEFEAAVEDLSRAIELDPQEKDAGANRARAMVLGIHQMIEAQKARDTAKNN